MATHAAQAVRPWVLWTRSTFQLFGIVGDVAEWSAAEPTALNVYPGETGTCRITFRPPKSAKARAGVTPFGVRINSTEDPQSSRVEEGAIEVLPHDEVTAELVPHV